jgi:hypothetical protein
MKSEKELAFLREIKIDEEWTQRFTTNFDDNFKFSDEESVLYLNAGIGNHTLAVREICEQKVNFTALCETEELLSIADAKAKAIKSKVNFTTLSPFESFETVIADLSFVKPDNLQEFFKETVNYSEKNVAFFLPTAGSFGEIFSLLWESLLNVDLLEYSDSIESLITEIPTVSQVEERLSKLGLKKIHAFTKLETFEFANSKEFIESTLIADFLSPNWLEFLDNKNQAKVLKALSKLIEAESEQICFTFSLKATLFVGQK